MDELIIEDIRPFKLRGSHFDHQEAKTVYECELIMLEDLREEAFYAQIICVHVIKCSSSS
ncbi:hypothetical protein NQ317_017220 [Molorchus minor]|uniref:Uncharacterized protein n=1 Tax=Molorchus minor TaxID=1323400 RepID=A0ABQ9JYI0_9CUCU|nr:hypothetical protein NQ317_017220 [Molorchus minor]